MSIHIPETNSFMVGLFFNCFTVILKLLCKDILYIYKHLKNTNKNFDISSILCAFESFLRLTHRNDAKIACFGRFDLQFG